MLPNLLSWVGGGRGTGAASNALSVSAANGPTKLVAMADVFQSKLDQSYNGLINKHKDQVDVPKDRRFIGFDSYQNAMDALDPGDVVIFTTPCAFRWLHFKYAIERTECFYGETGHRRWVFFKENARIERTGKKTQS